MPAETPLNPQKRLWLDPLIVVAITLLVFSPVLMTTFSPLDDYQMLSRNPAYHPPTGRGLVQQIAQPQFNIYAPLTYSIWYAIGMATYANGELPAWGYKIASWLAHAGSTAAAWWAIWLAVRHRAGAVLGALIFALHPLQVESVAWTTGLKDILCGGLTFLTIAFYIRRLETGKRKWGQYVLVAGILAMAAKPTALTLPATLLAIDFWVRDVPLGRRLRTSAPILPAAIVCAGIIYLVQKATNLAPQPFFLRPLIALDALAFYLFKLVWPLNLSQDYARTPELIRSSGAIAWTWIMPAIVGVAAMISRNRKVMAAGLVFLVPLSPVLGLVTFDMQQFTTVTDHYMYQSLFAVGLLLAMSIGRWRVVAPACCIVVMVLGGLTVRQLNLWSDSEAFLAESLRASPRSRLVRQVMTTMAIERGDAVEGERLAREVIDLGGDEIAWDHLSQSLEMQGRLIEAGEAARRMMDFMSDRTPVLRMRQIFSLAQRIPDADLARRAALHWSALDPTDPVPRQILRDLGPASRPKE